MPLTPEQRLLVALDTTDADAAAALAGRLKGAVGGAKVGSELFTARGPAAVRAIAAHGVPVFLDLKFHDIPNTVAGAIRSALALRPFMINVHASGGAAMMKAAAEAARAAGPDRPLVIAVTVLTSLDEHDLAAIGVHGSVVDQVVRLARMAWACGLDGVVTSAKEAMAIRGALGKEFMLVVPGIRPFAADVGDQKRFVTPKEAVALGADYLVIGRPITGAADPLAAARAIADGMRGP